MSPYEHGEVFVTDDGAETDLDLGHYERFIDENLSKDSSITMGKIYLEVLEKEREGELLLGQLEAVDYVILLDEKGNEYTSKAFADFLAQKMLTSMKRLVFIIGGPYGFSEEVYKRANMKISLSKMTFSHQMVRIIFTEQLYRAMTILKGEPYHHE